MNYNYNTFHVYKAPKHTVKSHEVQKGDMWLLISCLHSLEHKMKLEQLGRLHSEDTPCRPMITHTIDLFILDPKSKQDKVKITNLKNLPKLQIV